MKQMKGLDLIGFESLARSSIAFIVKLTSSNFKDFSVSSEWSKFLAFSLLIVTKASSK